MKNRRRQVKAGQDGRKETGSEDSFLIATGCSPSLSHRSCVHTFAWGPWLLPAGGSAIRTSHSSYFGSEGQKGGGEAFCPLRQTPFQGQSPPPPPHFSPCAFVGLGQRPKWVAFNLGFHAFLNLLLKEPWHCSPFMSGQLPVRMGEGGRAELRRGYPGPLFQEAAHSGGLFL